MQCLPVLFIHTHETKHDHRQLMMAPITPLKKSTLVTYQSYATIKTCLQETKFQFRVSVILDVIITCVLT